MTNSSGVAVDDNFIKIKLHYRFSDIHRVFLYFAMLWLHRKLAVGSWNAFTHIPKRLHRKRD